MPNLSLFHIVIRMLVGVVFAGFFCLPGTVKAKTNKACLDTFFEPRVSIEVKEAKPNLIHNKSLNQIARITKDKGFSTPSFDGQTLGFVRFKTHLKYKLKAEGLPIENNEACVRMTSAHLEVIVLRNDIFVAKEYKTGTCQFKVVLAHENEHVVINNRYLEEFVAAAKIEMKNFARRMYPFIVKSSHNVQEDLMRKLRRALQPLEENYHLKRKNAHMKIDTAESYQELNSRCEKW